MGLNRYRNQPCHCGSKLKFKHCHGKQHLEQKAEIVTQLARKAQAKESRYWKKRYDRVTGGE